MKKTIITFLSLVLLLSCLVLPAAAAATATTDSNGDGIIKVLTIGNSYALDSMPLITKIAKHHGQESMVVGWLYYPNCSLEMHYNYASKGSTVYDYHEATHDVTLANKTKKTTDENVSLLHGLQAQEWDYIFLQQAPCQAGMPSTFDTHLGNLISYVNENKTNPDAKLGWHLTWPYQKVFKDMSFEWSPRFIEEFGGDSSYMYQKIIETTQEKVLSRTIEGTEEPEFVMTVPNGTVLENAKTSYFGDNLQRDGYHLNQMGRIITAYTWYAMLTDKTGDNKLTSIDLSDADAEMTLSDTDRAVILESVNNAISNPYARTQSTHTDDRPHEDVYFALSEPQTSGGTLKAYHQDAPTTEVSVTYTGRGTYNVLSNGFYKLVDGKLIAQTVYDSKVATVGMHNYFLSYDAATQTLTLQDGSTATGHGSGTGNCGYTCYANPDGGHYELPKTIYNVPTTTPVVDVTGTDHGIETLADVIALSADHNIRLSHYAHDAGVPAAFYVDEITQLALPRYTVQDGDVVFIPGTTTSGALAEGYIVKSTTKSAGSKWTIAVPPTANKDDANGKTSLSRGRFWVMEGTILTKALGTWEAASNAKAYKFAYHDTITGYTPATQTADGTLKIDDATKHIGSTSSNCLWSFGNACGDSASSRYRETHSTLKVSASTPPVIINLTGHKCEDLQQVKDLTGSGEAIINVYAADGTKTAGTASVIVVLNPSSTFVPTYNVTVGYVENGAVTVDPTSGAAGTTVTVTATPTNDNYELEAICVDGVAIPDGGNTFTITTDHEVTAKFKAKPVETFTVTTKVEGNGAVTLNKTEYVLGDTAVVTVTPDSYYTIAAPAQPEDDTTPFISTTAESDYELTSLIVDGTDVTDQVENGKYTFTIRGDATIQAVFAKSTKPEFEYANVVLGNELNLNFAIKVSHFDAMEGLYAVMECVDGTVQTVQQTAWGDPRDINGVDYYVITYTGLAAKQMGDAVTITIYDEAGDALTKPCTRSIESYIQDNLEKVDTLTKTLFVDMLNYGAAAQVEFSYKTEDLVNSWLSAAQQAYGTVEMAACEDDRVVSEQEYYYGTNLVLEDRISMQMAYKGLAERNLRAEVTFTDHYGNGASETIDNAKIESRELSDGSVLRVVRIESIVVADGRRPVTCKLYDADNDTLLSECTDSMESYIARNAKGDYEWMQTIMNFSDSAYAYLHQNDQ